MTDRFDHFDRHELVEATAQIAIVFEQHGDALAERVFLHAPARQIILLARDRRRRDMASEILRRMQRETAPARADFDDAIVRPQIELAADAIELSRRRLLERVGCVREYRRRIHQVFVEEQREEIVAEIIMRGDILAAAAARVPAQRMPRAHGHSGETRRTALHRIEQIAVAHQHAHQCDEIVALPATFHERFARADAAVSRDGSIERGIVDPHGRTQRERIVSRRCAEHAFAHRIDDAQLAVAQHVELTQQTCAQQFVGRAERDEFQRKCASGIDPHLCGPHFQFAFLG